MIDWKLILKNIIETIKLPTKFIIWLFLLSSVLLFLLFKKVDWLIALGIEIIIKEYKPYIVFIFIASTLLLLIELSICLWIKFKKIYSKKYTIRKIATKLISLSPEEKAILREYFLQQKTSIEMPINDQVVSKLIKYNVLEINYYSTGEMSAVGNLYLMSISSEAERLITPELINWPNEGNRPWFMEIIEKTRKRHSWMAR